MMSTLASHLATFSPEEHGFTFFDSQTSPQATGRLSGWIIPAKDLYDVAGMPTTFGSIARTHMAQRTDPFLQNLLDQGAIIPGKSSASELGMSIDTEPAGLPKINNPLHPGCTPGGSSGGAAVMVARGLVRAAHASDAGGSIRVPAAATGTVGFKPSGEQLSAQGFITTTVADQIFLHNIMPTPRRLRIGVLTEPLFVPARVDKRWIAGVQAAAEQLRKLGHEVHEVRPYPNSEDTFRRFGIIFSTRVAQNPQAANADGLIGWVAREGAAFIQADVEEAEAYSRSIAKVLSDYYEADILLTPTLASDPPAIGTFSSLPPAQSFAAQTSWSPWNSLFNLAGTAAISLPWSHPDGGTPTAIHLGALGTDNATLLGLAAQVHP